MAAAIVEFGFRIPIVARSTGEVVDGHLRLKAARKLGLDYVTLTRGVEQTVAFKFPLADDWPTNRLRIAIFAQDHQSGIVHQVLDLPWRNTEATTNAPSVSPAETGVKPPAKEVR